MEAIQRHAVEQRAHTDASLGAERANTDVDTGHRTAIDARHRLDDLIERDRILADKKLFRFRDNADIRLARERFASGAQESAVADERSAADRGTRAERRLTDDLLGQERLRSDNAVEKERGEEETHRANLDACRQDTDNQLSTERRSADVAVSALGDAHIALAYAQRGQEQRDDVFGMVAHDLRSPLSVIAITAEHLAEVTQETSTRESAQNMTRAAARMERLLCNLLEVARIESGTLHISKQPHDVGALLVDVLQSYRALFADRGMTFSVDPPATPIVALFDYDRIVQVLSNLLGNALKFTPRGGTVVLTVNRQRDDQIEFILLDDGPGIAPAALPHVFERFWQIDNQARRGLGLGLYICDKIVSGHGGRIWVESELGKGAAFHFLLPIAQKRAFAPPAGFSRTTGSIGRRSRSRAT